MSHTLRLARAVFSCLVEKDIVIAEMHLYFIDSILLG